MESDKMEGTSNGDGGRRKSTSRPARKTSITMDNRARDTVMMVKTMDEPVKPASSMICEKFGVVVAEILLLGVLVATYFWVFHFEGGVAWQFDVKRQFNLHFILMITGLVFLIGQAALVYKVFTFIPHAYAKAIHAFINFAGAACMAVGFYVAYETNDRVSRGTHFYTLHSWLAFGTCGFIALQLLLGIFCFVFLRCCASTATFRQDFKSTHTAMGLIILTTGAATAVTGLMQAIRARLNGQNLNPDYRDFPAEAILVNVIAVCILASVAVTIMLIIKAK